jgi:hypothetical protein
MGESKTTTNHDTIREWVKQRGGQPATVTGTGSGDDVGLLRIDFPGYGEDERLEALEWEDFFEKFDQSKLAFLYQDETPEGETSRFCKFVNR